jgi:asparagine N-glycosylation enzyme membrane subunit Stt3
MMITAKDRNVVGTAAMAIIGLGLAILAWVALPTQQGLVALTVLVILGVLAIRRRPPARDGTGRRMRSTTIVNSALALGIVAVPIGIAAVGLLGGQSAAPLIVGIGLAGFGLMAFALYSFVWVATKRASVAAAVALSVAGVVSAWLVLPALFDQVAGRNPF